ncbi:uncharacterized protein LOC125225761 [Leguminivora glycinivorella]|uniref:uncharacterized protein LOC125225761 n=1 Tax=Leguminivora glycinivorella TaxID=1035111 RepID=UPI00200F24E5|nr:uncharacterized protein LOC125225761 [Leguminivora glycinivorella]
MDKNNSKRLLPFPSNFPEDYKNFVRSLKMQKRNQTDPKVDQDMDTKQENIPDSILDQDRDTKGENIVDSKVDQDRGTNRDNIVSDFRTLIKDVPDEKLDENVGKSKVCYKTLPTCNFKVTIRLIVLVFIILLRCVVRYDV